MVRVSGGDDAHPGAEPVESTVEFISLNNYEIAVAQYVVGAIVLGDTSEEGIAVQMTLVHDMCTHGGCGSLSVCTSHTEAFMSTGESTQYLCTLLYRKTVLTEIFQFLVLSGDGWSIDYQTRLSISASLWNLMYIFLVMDEHTLAFQLFSQLRRSLVITGYYEAFVQKITGDGAHTDA